MSSQLRKHHLDYEHGPDMEVTYMLKVRDTDGEYEVKVTKKTKHPKGPAVEIDIPVSELERVRVNGKCLRAMVGAKLSALYNVELESCIR